MSWPRQVRGIAPERTARSPYNFVPLPAAVYLPQEGKGESLSGFVELEITTKSPLYTRCAYPPMEEARTVTDSPPRQEFYHHGDTEQPVIPGSSLRGALRALVEIIGYGRMSRTRTDGKVVRIVDERLIHRAVADQRTPTGQAYNNRFMGTRVQGALPYPGPAVRAGYLEADGNSPSGFSVRPAKVYHGLSFIRVDQAALRSIGVSLVDNSVVKLYVRPAAATVDRSGRVPLLYARTTQVAHAPSAGLEAARLVIGGPMRTRRMYPAVYEPDPAAVLIPISGEQWEQFVTDRDAQRGIPCRKIQEGDPCFYLMEGNQLTFFGPALFFRIPFKHATSKFLPLRLRADGSLDLAERLFGTIIHPSQSASGSKDPAAHRGKVQVEDARWLAAPGQSPFFPKAERRTLGILSTPKPTSFQHYLVQTSDDRGSLKDYNAETPRDTVLRGHKRYWHRGPEPAPTDFSPKAPAKGDTQRTVVRPVLAGVRFQGRLRFSDLNPEELGTLLAALELPQGCAHQLGMGKPLGLGSVAIVARVQLIDVRRRYTSLAETGLLTPAELEPKLEAARRAFVEAIRQHVRESGEAGEAQGDLWEIPRLRALRALLDFDRRPAATETVYMNVEEFRERKVLPVPEEVGAKAPSRVAPTRGVGYPPERSRPR